MRDAACPLSTGGGGAKPPTTHRCWRGQQQVARPAAHLTHPAARACRRWRRSRGGRRSSTSGASRPSSPRAARVARRATRRSTRATSRRRAPRSRTVWSCGPKLFGLVVPNCLVLWSRTVWSSYFLLVSCFCLAMAGGSANASGPGSDGRRAQLARAVWRRRLCGAGADGCGCARPRVVARRAEQEGPEPLG